MLRRRLPLLVLALAGCGAMPAAGGECGRLDLSATGGEIEARFTVARASGWRVTVVHEGHVVWRGYEHGAVTVTRRIKEYTGPDHVTARASSRDGKVCVKTGVVTS